MSYKLLKQAADQLDALATALEAAEVSKQGVQKTAAEIKAAEEKVAAEKAAAEKTAADLKTKRLALAKTAADKLLEAGLLSSPEKRDLFAAEITDPEVALQKLAKLAESVTVPKVGVVVSEGTQNKVASSDEVWAQSVVATLSRLNLK